MSALQGTSQVHTAPSCLWEVRTQTTLVRFQQFTRTLWRRLSYGYILRAATGSQSRGGPSPRYGHPSLCADVLAAFRAETCPWLQPRTVPSTPGLIQTVQDWQVAYMDPPVPECREKACLNLCGRNFFFIAEWLFMIWMYCSWFNHYPH